MDQKRIIEMATGGEIEQVKILCDLKRKIICSWEHKIDDYRALSDVRLQLTGFRRIVRKRYANSMKSGMYKVTRSNVYPLEKIGTFGEERSWRKRLVKGSLLTWVSRDEMGTNWFLLDGKIFGVNGASIDSIAPIEQCSTQK